MYRSILYKDIRYFEKLSKKIIYETGFFFEVNPQLDVI